ncbi:MAG: FAD-dependent oxidoreductase [Roseiflexaceae bacterium]
MKSHAQAVIIGGGIAGCSIAYHLTLLGWRDIVLVEKGELTSGSTFHSAGLVGQLRSSASLTRMMVYSADLYHRLKDETGHDPSFHQVGSLRVASSTERMDELRRQVAFARTVGLPAELIGPQEACDLFPPMVADGIEGALWLPTDGHIDPSGLALALARGARQGGAEIHVGTTVRALDIRGGRVRGVVTDRGTIQADHVVIAGGAWTPLVARLAGVNVPIMPFAHQYVVTRPVKGVARGLPTMRDPDKLVYFKEELGGFVMGGYERNPAPYDYDRIPPDFNHQLLEPDWDRFMSILDAAIERVPAIAEAEVIKLINGFEAFTPDGEFILGEAPELRGLWLACGFCAQGIAGGGGVGKVMAEWIVEGQPFVDLAKMDVRRFAAHYRSKELARTQTYEIYATYYDIHLPTEERAAVRDLRLSPMYARLKELGVSFGEKAGWERPNVFTSVAEEHRATRERAGLFDMTSFSKILVQGPGALALLQRITDNQIDKPVGSITYTQMLNARGGIECDLTITRLAADRFYIVTGTAFGPHDIAHIRRQAPDDGSVYIDDVTSSRAVVGLWGPRARDILRLATDDDISNAAAPYLSARMLTVGRAPVLALRVTYVGELGWELHTPAEYGLHLWDTLWAAGRTFDIMACGYHAIDTLRFEKGYRYWSTELTPEYTPYEAGLGFCVKLEKGEFVGRAALLEQKRRGLARKLCCLLLDDGAPIVWGREPICAGDEVLGRVTGGNFGHTVGRGIAYGYLPIERAAVGTRLAIDIGGTLWGATVAAEPLWDARNERIKG